MRYISTFIRIIVFYLTESDEILNSVGARLYRVPLRILPKNNKRFIDAVFWFGKSYQLNPNLFRCSRRLNNEG
jgi:hypothetical protein